MKFLFAGLTALLLTLPTGVLGQLTAPVPLPASKPIKAKKPAPRPVPRKKTPLASVAAVPSGPVLTVPSWLPPDAPERPAAAILTEVTHTKLDVRFDYRKQYLLGTATLTLRPHFFSQNQVVLDAKGFDIQKLELIGADKKHPISYTYDKRQLTILLGRTYTRAETYQLRIQYVAKPNELPRGGSDAITSDKGLYFINPLGLEKNKPRQIWTQGETESSSCWFPTIDKPNQRMTQEINLTVENQFKTLSNGLLVSSKENPDGTRTDTWRQALPHPPYLATMVVGDFAVVHDDWCGKAVDYYVEPQYAGTAKATFGRTPEMMEFYSKLLGVDYAWEKYAQVPVRDYVSGAMENTSATTHGATIQRTRRELLDDNYETGEATIAHELFHQWFGDLVTCESWSNLPLNESFADYSEYLWAEHKLGPDEAALVQETKLNNYLDEAHSKREPLIRYRYAEREAMFDRHSYDKGGRVLHMLRKMLGDEAFFASLNRYLTRNRGTAVEIAKLRLAFEETTGQDLQWFFSQWFMQRGHPELKVSHTYANGQVLLRVQQVQDTLFQPVFRLPLSVAVWGGNNLVTEHKINVTRTDQTFRLPAAQRPQLVKLDPDGQLLAQLEEERTPEELTFQFSHAKGYQQKAEVLELLQNKTNELVISMMYRAALHDSFWAIRCIALEHLRHYRGPEPEAVRRDILRLASADPVPRVRAGALRALVSFSDNKFGAAYLAALQDSSYLVNATAVECLIKTPGVPARAPLIALDDTPSVTLLLALASYHAQYGTLDQYPWFLRRLPDVSEPNLYGWFQSFGVFMTRIPPVERDRGIRLLEDYARNSPTAFVRLGAYRGLMALLPTSPQVKSLLQNIREHETDERLKASYSLM